jgi:hypothetical protein
MTVLCRSQLKVADGDPDTCWQSADVPTFTLCAGPSGLNTR